MKRHEVLVSHYKKAEEDTKNAASNKVNELEQAWLRGVLSREEIGELHSEMLEMNECHIESIIRAERVKWNLRRAHVAYCRARITSPQVQLLTHRESLALAIKSPQVVTEIHSPELELIENSLPSHAPPLEPRFQNGTGSS